MWRKLLLFFSVIFLFVFAASSVRAVTPTPGGMCGGFAGVACPTGYICVYSNGTAFAPFPDASGSCQVMEARAKVTLTPTPQPMCGGIRGLICPTGYVCKYSDGSTRAPFPDASGTCVVAPTSERTTPTPTPAIMCGGIMGAVCPTGLFCIYSDGTTRAPFPDASGYCGPDPRIPKATLTPTTVPRACNSGCQVNSDCESGYCYQPPMPACPSGMACIQVMPGKVCRKTICATSSDCSCNTPTPTCMNRPACLDATPPCLLAEPSSGWCPQTTPTEKPGDSNGDNRVDGRDYITWLTNYGLNLRSGASSGDYNNDATVDGKDYIVWLTNYGS